MSKEERNAYNQEKENDSLFCERSKMRIDSILNSSDTDEMQIDFSPFCVINNSTTEEALKNLSHTSNINLPISVSSNFQNNPLSTSSTNTSIINPKRTITRAITKKKSILTKQKISNESKNAGDNDKFKAPLGKEVNENNLNNKSNSIEENSKLNDTENQFASDPIKRMKQLLQNLSMQNKMIIESTGQLLNNKFSTEPNAQQNSSSLPNEKLIENSVNEIKKIIEAMPEIHSQMQWLNTYSNLSTGEFDGYSFSSDLTGEYGSSNFHQDSNNLN